MRPARFSGRLLIAAVTCLISSHAIAAVAWTEAKENGKIVTRWTRGADINEVFAAVRTSSGPDYRVLSVCRQAGYFAYVGSATEVQRGISCGFETSQAALFLARQNCEIEQGRCDVERVGYDDGSSIIVAGQGSKLPSDLPGSTATGGNINAPSGPVQLQ